MATNGSGQLKNLTAENKGSDGNPVFARRPLVRVPSPAKPPTTTASLRLWRHDLETGKSTPLSPCSITRSTNMKFSPDGSSCGCSPRKRVASAFQDERRRNRLHKVQRRFSPRASNGGNCCLPEYTFNRPDELFALDPATGEARQLTRFNEKRSPSLIWAKSSEFVCGGGRSQVQRWLFYPPGYDANKKYPFIHVMHGGPHTMMRDAGAIAGTRTSFAAPGYVVACVNRHGSTGFGEKFARAFSTNGATSRSRTS